MDLKLFIQELSALEGMLAVEVRAWSAALKQRAGADPGTYNNLVEQLQYHDIIRQKIQHVVQLLEPQVQESEPENHTEKTVVLPEMMELSIAILKYTMLEYRNMGERIGKLLEEAPGIFLKQQPSLFENEINKLIKKLEQVYLELDVPEESRLSEQSIERLRQIWNSFSMQSERDIFAMLFEDYPFNWQEISAGEDPEGQIELF